MKNPNGFGTVYKVTGNRRKPWRAIKTMGFDISKGSQIRKTVGYFETRREALESLITFKFDPYNIEVENLTIDDIYNRWKEMHFKKLSKLSQNNYESNYTHFKPLKDRKIAELKTMHLQEFMNNLELSESSKRNIKRMLNQLFKYALKYDIIGKDYTQFIELGKVERILERKIFTDEEITKLWKYKELEWIDTILIMIYTGMRVGELLTIKNQDIDLENRTIRGGIKTDAGKNRLIPINMKILPFIKARMSPSNEYLVMSKRGRELAYRTYLTYFRKAIDKLDIVHTIHDCRHTFASLLSNADANKVSIAKIIGHSNYDMTEKIYTHKDIEELKKAIDLI